MNALKSYEYVVLCMYYYINMYRADAAYFKGVHKEGGPQGGPIWGIMLKSLERRQTMGGGHLDTPPPPP